MKTVLKTLRDNLLQRLHARAARACEKRKARIILNIRHREAILALQVETLDKLPQLREERTCQGYTLIARRVRKED